MTPEGARTLLQLLQRIDLKGAEAAVFMRIVQELELDMRAGETTAARPNGPGVNHEVRGAAVPGERVS